MNMLRPSAVLGLRLSASNPNSAENKPTAHTPNIQDRMATTAEATINLESDEPAHPPPTVWVEKTMVQDRPDRVEGPDMMGAALWSPQRAADGRDLYANMREVKLGDLVLHLTDNEAITGLSLVAGPLDDTFRGIAGTAWADRPCYRVALRDFRSFDPPLRREWFFGDAEIGERLRAVAGQPRGRGLFFNSKLELNQGAYLTEAPPMLTSALDAAFVRNFFRLEQSQYSVAAEMIPWPAHCVNAQDADYLPAMITDVTLRSADRTIVIDAKFYKDTFVSRFGTRPKVRSGHLYQLQSYLTNMERRSSQIAPEGVLLYPSIDGEEVRLDFQLPQHRIRVCTVDMARPWQHVHHRLLDLVDAPMY